MKRFSILWILVVILISVDAPGQTIEVNKRFGKVSKEEVAMKVVLTHILILMRMAINGYSG